MSDSKKKKTHMKKAGRKGPHRSHNSILILKIHACKTWTIFECFMDPGQKRWMNYITLHGDGDEWRGTHDIVNSLPPFSGSGLTKQTVPTKPAWSNFWSKRSSKTSCIPSQALDWLATRWRCQCVNEVQNSQTLSFPAVSWLTFPHHSSHQPSPCWLLTSSCVVQPPLVDALSPRYTQARD